MCRRAVRGYGRLEPVLIRADGRSWTLHNHVRTPVARTNRLWINTHTTRSAAGVARFLRSTNGADLLVTQVRHQLAQPGRPNRQTRRPTARRRLHPNQSHQYLQFRKRGAKTSTGGCT
jgi:hypothetical protein